MFQKIIFGALMLYAIGASAQDTRLIKPGRKRLDFAKTYFELGGTYLPSFKGKRVENNSVVSFNHEGSVNQYLTWGAFHFWGHAEFYVNFPLGRLNLSKSTPQTYQLDQSVVTGARFYPLPMQEGKLRPFVGLSWGALDFKQITDADKNSPLLAKDFLLNAELGLLYNYKNFGLRLGINYNADNKWNYPLNRELKSEIKTPAFTGAVGLLYAFDLSKDTKKENIEKWNSYPRTSKLSHKAGRNGNFFIGFGPSLSFSLSKSAYNQSELPYLKDRLASRNYFDIALGYHLNKANLFAALSFRNPKFQTKGYGSEQTIRKTAVALELNKFLTDYTGFAPYVGINVSYDQLRYSQVVDGGEYHTVIKGKFEPGLTFGWDIVPGKTDEALILRTNLRWYPFSGFEIREKRFDFKQLEYNLIQLVFYPERLKKKKANP